MVWYLVNGVPSPKVRERGLAKINAKCELTSSGNAETSARRDKHVIMKASAVVTGSQGHRGAEGKTPVTTAIHLSIYSSREAQ